MTRHGESGQAKIVILALVGIVLVGAAVFLMTKDKGADMANMPPMPNIVQNEPVIL